MKRFSFSSFETQDVNCDAFDACHAVAELQPSDRQPLVLLGDHGAGKTHLMCAIVNSLRAGTIPVGLAYVTAREFPREVRMLVTDPAPVENAERAVLLVDQLESFTEYIEQLQAVVQIFLDNHHDVVLGTSVHPSRLRALPEDLRTLLERGRIVPLRPRPTSPSSGASPHAPDALERVRSESRLLHERVAQLEEQLDRAQQKAAVAGQADELRRELQTQMERAAESADASGDVAALRREIEEQAERAEDRIQKLRAQLDAQHQQADEAKHEEAAELRRQLAAAAEQAERAAAKLTHGAEQRKELREQLDAAQSKADQAAQEAAGLRHQLEEQLRTARERDAATMQDADTLRHDLDQARAEMNELAGQVDAERESGEAVRNELSEAQEQLAGLQYDLQAAQQTAQDATREAETLRGDIEQQAQAEEEAAALRGQLDEAMARIETLQREASETNLRIEALLEQVEQNRAEFGRTQQQHRERASELRALADVAGDERLPPIPLGDTEFAESAHASDGEQAPLAGFAGTDELTRAKAEAAQARKAHDDVLDKLDRLTAKHAQLELDADRMREQFDSQAGDMDALRHEAATQVAAANAQAGEIERKYGDLYSSLDGARQTEYDVAEGLEGLRRRLIDTSDTMAQLASNLAEGENGAPVQPVEPQGADESAESGGADAEPAAD